MLRRVADPRSVLGGVRGSTPEHLGRPAVRVEQPEKSLSDVLLPAPFDPSNPVMPLSMSKLTASSALTWPKVFVRSPACRSAIAREATRVCG